MKKILFATNLTKNCKAALEASISLSNHYNAVLVLLHVIEDDIPFHAEGRIRAAIGEEKWEELQAKNQQHARDILIGKMSSENFINSALLLYCHDAGITDTDSCVKSYETIVAKGDIVTSILIEAIDRKCEMIILGARKGFLKNNKLGSVVKGVMRKKAGSSLFHVGGFGLQAGN